MSGGVGRARKRWLSAVDYFGRSLRVFDENPSANAMRSVEYATGEVCRAALGIQRASRRVPAGMLALATLSDRWARSEYERASQRYGRPLSRTGP